MKIEYAINKLRMSKFLISLFFVLISMSQVFAQEAKEILCRVIDIESKYPVSYATIKFADVQNGVIADEEGGFRLPADYKTLNKAIIISSIGFATLTINAGTLKDNTINDIYLKPRREELNEVVLKVKTKSTRNSISPETIIKNAVGRIATNYPYYPHSYISYYRDYQLINNSYFNLNEAIMENFDAGFNTSKFKYKDNTSALYSYQLNKNFNQDTLSLNSIYGESKLLDTHKNAKLGTNIQNELELLNLHNPIRNFNKNSFSFIYIFKDNFIDNHNFKLSKIVYIEDTPLYEIKINSRAEQNSRYKAEGNIYISKTNFAIHKLEYRVFENSEYSSGRSKDNPFGNLNRSKGSTLFEINIEYKTAGNKMFLNYMTFNNRFIIKEPNPFKVEDFNFNASNESFYITFNKAIDDTTIKRKSNFKLRYKDKKLIVTNIKLVEDKTVKIEVIDWSAGIANDVKVVSSGDFSYKLKKIKDVSGAELNKASMLVGYQFRELFTQEIFEQKQPVEDLIYVNKKKPLSYANINKTTIDIKKYWINTPLKQTKDN